MFGASNIYINIYISKNIKKVHNNNNSNNNLNQRLVKQPNQAEDYLPFKPHRHNALFPYLVANSKQDHCSEGVVVMYFPNQE